MKRASVIILAMLLLAGGLFLAAPGGIGWAAEETPVEEQVEQDPGVTLSQEEETVIYSESSAEPWDEWEDSTAQ